MVGLAAALVLGPWVAGAGAQSSLSPLEARREFFPMAGAVMDEPVEMAYWAETQTTEWIYVAGWMSIPQTGGGTAKVMAVARYNATNLSSSPEFAYFPPNPGSGIGSVTYKATGIVVDPDNGDVYICGEGTAATGTTDFYVAKYRADLSQFVVNDPGYWAPDGTAFSNVRRYDGDDEGVDRPVDIILADAGTNKRVIVTGSTETASEGDDYLTIAYDANDGDEKWVRQVDHEDGDDQPVEMAAWEVVGDSTATTPQGFYVAVAGTSYDTTTGRDFMVLRYYVPDPSVLGGTLNARYAPAGDDICTGIAPPKQSTAGGAPVRIGLSGSTTPNTGSPDDTAFVIATFNVVLEAWWTTTNSARVWNPSDARDIAVDVADAGGVFWAMGNVALNADGDQHGVGVMAYQNSQSAPLVGTDLFNDGASDGNDSTAHSVFGVGEGCYGIGKFINPNNDPSEYYLLLHYGRDGSYTTIDLVGLGTYNAGSAMEHGGRAVGVFGNSRLFTTGVSGSTTTGIDWVTLRY